MMYAEVYKWFTETSGLGLTQQAELLMNPKAANKEDDIAEVINMGVNGIISDYPDRVIRFLYGKEI